MKRLNLRQSTIICVLTGVALGTPLGARADYASTLAGLSPVAYYRLSTTNLIPSEFPATNIGSLGTGFNGQYQAMSLSRGQPGAMLGDSDTSVSIDGSAGQQVVVPYSPQYNPNGPFSVEFWAKPAVGSTASGNHTAAISMVNGQNPSNADDRSGWCLRHNAADWQFILGYDHSDGATFYGTTLTASGSVVEDAWQHVVAVYTPDLVSLYVNGVLVVSQPPEAGFPMLPNTAAPLILGDRGYTGWDFLGLLDEVAIYTTALTTAEVLAHYNNGTNASRPTPYRDLVVQKNPALYYRLDEPTLQLPVAINIGSFGAAANGTYMPGSTPGVPGPQMPAVTGFETTNVAVGLDGIDGIVEIPGIPLNSDAVTFAFWMKPDGVQAVRATMIHQRKVTEPQVKATGVQYGDDGRTLSYNWEDNGSDYTWNPGFAPPDGAWTFVAVAVSPDDAVMYMGSANGLQAATNPVAHVAHDFSGATIELGWDNYQTTRKFRGALDEAALFDKTLTYAQVKSLFDAAQPAILGVTRTPVDPVYEGMTVTFTATVAGTSPVFQWRKDGQELAASTNAMLTLNNVVTNDSGSYDLVVTSGGQTVTSPPSHLEVLTSPPILTQVPASAVRFINGTVSFTVAAIGSQPLTYQWQHSTTAIPGATGATLNLSDLQPADAGDYTVMVSNVYGTKQATATLTLSTPAKYSAAIVDAGPVGYWRLDESTGTTAYDYWGGHEGIYSFGVTNNTVGPRPTAFAGFDASNTAYEFAGGASKVVIPPLNLNKDTVTFVAWIYPKGNQVDYAGLVFARGGTATGLDYKGTTGQVGYHWNDAANTYSWDSGLLPVADQWNFVALVVEPTQATMYLDSGTGLENTVNAVTHGAATFADPLRIGADSPDGGRGFVGRIDEVTIYDHALSLAQITAIRNAGFTGAYNPTTVTLVQQPKGETIMAGSSYTLSAKASGSVPLTYQWQKDGLDIPGAIRSSLEFTSAAESDTGTYQLFVTQGATKISSAQATLTVKPVPSYINLSENLVLHLKFDGDYSDSSGRANNGTPQGSPTIVSGKIGNGALHYTTIVSGGGVTEANYVSLGMPADLQFGTNVNFSVAFWIKFVGSPGDLPFLANNTGSMGGPGVTIAPSYNEGGWSWGLNDSVVPQPWPGIGLYDPVKNTLNDGNWHNVVHTFDRAGNGTTYLDGVLVHSMSIVSATGWDLDTGMEWDMGQAGGSYAEQGDFTMDDLGVWRKALNKYDAESIYIVGENYGRSFDVSAPPEVRVQIQKTAAGVKIEWPNGTLESSDRADGGFAPVPGATPPSYLVEPATGNRFFRVKL